MYGEKQLTLALTYLGALPFVAAALATSFGLGDDWPSQAFLAYGAVIASFMAGTIWMQAQAFAIMPKQLLLFSNAAALIAFAAIVSPVPPVLSLMMQALAFAGLLFCDFLVARFNKQPPWYFTLRRNVTLVVLATYVFMLVVV